MEIVINHLTRMQAGYMCVAGVNPQTKRHIRLEPPSRRMETSMLARNDGPFDIGNRILLENLIPDCKKPQIEDHIFDPQSVTNIGKVPNEKFWELLCSISRTRLRDIFGEELDEIGLRSCGTPEGKGQASLGGLSSAVVRNLRIEKHWGRSMIRIDVCDDEFIADLSVTDIRLYEGDHVTPAEEQVKRVAERMRQSTSVLLSVGLGRAYDPHGGSNRFHYLQVNNIHLEENPVRQLG